MTASFAGLFYTSLWLGGKLHIMDNRGEAWKSLLVMVPILAATLVAVSRIMDARHHPFDVITGSLLGVVCAVVSYRQYFPPLTEAWRKGRAYPIRTWGTEPPRPVDAQLTAFNDDSTSALRNPEHDRLNPSIEPDRSLSPSARPGPPGASGYAGRSNPFASQVYPRRRHDQDPDGNWSSSEDHGYVMAQNPGATRGYSPPLNTNTAYQSPIHAASGGAHPHPEGEGSQPGRGRQLTDAPLRDV